MRFLRITFSALFILFCLLVWACYALQESIFADGDIVISSGDSFIRLQKSGRIILLVGKLGASIGGIWLLFHLKNARNYLLAISLAFMLAGFVWQNGKGLVYSALGAVFTEVHLPFIYREIGCDDRRGLGDCLVKPSVTEIRETETEFIFIRKDTTDYHMQKGTLFWKTESLPERWY